MASETISATEAGANKAQAEFETYKRRTSNAPASASASSKAQAGPQAADQALSWTAPFGVGMTPVWVGGPPPGAGRGVAGEIGGAVGAVSEGVGTTVRLGVDLLNAILFNSVKILGGFTGAYGHHEGGCGCESCCEPSCCEPDCCGCECCNPGVGSCC
jgi:hypothetical protein